jgi:predicted nucleotidyltransferase
VTEESRFLIALAKDLAAAYLAQAQPRAILLTGSAAKGLSDAYSDLDLIIYYETPPTAERLAAVRATLQASDIRVSSDPETDSAMEMYVLQDVECQVAHLPIAKWERDMQAVLEDCEPGTFVEKALIGLLDGIALHGEDLLTLWQERAASYPDGLARATVAHYLRFFPLWLVAEQWRTRDATIFFTQMLVEVSLNLLGVLAGLNRRYFSTFQFKRLHHFAGTLPVTPDRLADRLDEIFALDPVAAAMAMEHLVEETILLVEACMPAVDTASVRRSLGKRQRPWLPPPGRW